MEKYTAIYAVLHAEPQWNWLSTKRSVKLFNWKNQKKITKTNYTNKESESQ